MQLVALGLELQLRRQLGVLGGQLGQRLEHPFSLLGKARVGFQDGLEGGLFGRDLEDVLDQRVAIVLRAAGTSASLAAAAVVAVAAGALGTAGTLAAAFGVRTGSGTGYARRR